MKFLLDANLPRSAADWLRNQGHLVEDVRQVLPEGAEDALVARYAQTHRLVLITRDFDFADIRNYPPQQYGGIIVLELPDDAVASQVVLTLQNFVSQPTLLVRLAGRLAIVSPWRVRFRPPESTGQLRAV